MVTQIKRLRDKGDTLVEVLISIAIVSMVITGAYAIANRSLHQGITASEHTQALKLAQGQLESLKFRQQQSSRSAFLDQFAARGGGPANFCLNVAATGPGDVDNWKPIPNGDDTQNLQTGSGSYNSACLDSQYSKYYMNINVQNKNVSGTIQTVYYVTVSWAPIGGGPNAQTALYYRF